MIETLKVVTETTVTTTTTVVTEEKYKVVAPETMHETFMSDSEDEAEQDNMMGDHSFKYLTGELPHSSHLEFAELVPKTTGYSLAWFPDTLNQTESNGFQFPLQWFNGSD